MKKRRHCKHIQDQLVGEQWAVVMLSFEVRESGSRARPPSLSPSWVPPISCSSSSLALWANMQVAEEPRGEQGEVGLTPCLSTHILWAPLLVDNKWPMLNDFSLCISRPIGLSWKSASTSSFWVFQNVKYFGKISQPFFFFLPEKHSNKTAYFQKCTEWVKAQWNSTWDVIP